MRARKVRIVSTILANDLSRKERCSHLVSMEQGFLGLLGISPGR